MTDGPRPLKVFERVARDHAVESVRRRLTQHPPQGLVDVRGGRTPTGAPAVLILGKFTPEVRATLPSSVAALDDTFMPIIVEPPRSPVPVMIPPAVLSAMRAATVAARVTTGEVVDRRDVPADTVRLLVKEAGGAFRADATVYVGAGRNRYGVGTGENWNTAVALALRQLADDIERG